MITVLNIFSCEWLLKNKDNGGVIIFLRSLIISGIIFTFAIAFLNLIDVSKNLSFSSKIFSEDAVEHFEWYGAIFAVVYLALYSRFSSQWSYLANLYNLIKQTQSSSGVNLQTIAEWKAGFIEDAQYLHLSHKENFAPIIKNWLNDIAVKNEYVKNSPQGFNVDIFIENINNRVEKINIKYKN